MSPPDCSTTGPITAGTISASSLAICASQAVTLSSTGFSYGTGMVYQWEYFNGSIWVALGQNNPSVATVSPASTTQYRLAVKCNAGTFVYSNTLVITVNNPTVTPTTPLPRCGVGTVNINATAASGTIDWYAASTGGTALYSSGSPSTFVTPVISSTTTYYVANSIPAAVPMLAPPIQVRVLTPPM